jgi:hypothetical protein
MKLKERIEGIQAIPFLDKFTVRIIRHLDRFHVGTARDYSVRYSNPEKVKRLESRYLQLLKAYTDRIIKERIERWNS